MRKIRFWEGIEWNGMECFDVVRHVLDYTTDGEIKSRVLQHLTHSKVISAQKVAPVIILNFNYFRNFQRKLSFVMIFISPNYHHHPYN